MRRLTEFEQILLFALLRLGEEAYGVTIRREIEERAGQSTSPGAIYTALSRLEDRGLVESWFGDPTPERGGKRKKHYRLTPRGAEALDRSYSAIRGMAEDQVAKLRSLAERHDG